MKKSFLIHYSDEEIIDALTDEEAGKLLKAFIYYHTRNEKPQFERTLNLVWLPFKQRFDNEQGRYEEIYKTRKETGKKGGAPKGNQNARKKNNQNNQNNQNNHTDTDIDIDTQLSKDSVCNTHVRACETPTLSQVKDVCKVYGFDEQLGEKFYLHYQANGWVQGTGVAIRDWVAQLNKWVADQNKFEKPTANGKPAKYKEREYSDSEFDALFEDLKTVEL